MTATPTWNWPDDDSQTVSINRFYTISFRKAGLSQVHAARLLPDDAPETFARRKSFPVLYLFKYGLDALAERLYYRLASFIDLPQQHVFWGVSERYPLVAAAAIRYEADACRPRQVDQENGTATYRRRQIPVANAPDFSRHRLLHAICGTGDINQVMLKNGLLFGIDAADCKFAPRFGLDGRQLWQRSRAIYSPAGFQAMLDMAARLAAAGENALAELLRAEVLSAPCDGFLSLGEARLYAAATTGVVPSGLPERFRASYDPAAVIEHFRQNQPELLDRELMAEKIVAGFRANFRAIVPHAAQYTVA